MEKREIKIVIDTQVLEDIEGYASISQVSTEHFIVKIIKDFVLLQKSELEEVYQNDDGSCWLMSPTEL